MSCQGSNSSLCLLLMLQSKLLPVVLRPRWRLYNTGNTDRFTKISVVQVLGAVPIKRSEVGGYSAMAGAKSPLTAAVTDYFDDLRRIRASGGATDELSYYPPLANLLNAVGNLLRPKVFCVSGRAQQGAGHPDCGLYAAKQIQKGKPREGQLPECGVVEVKPTGEDA